MITLYELGQDILRIRKVFNDLEIKGEVNAGLIVYGVRKCDDIIKAINKTAEEKEDKANNEYNSDES